MLRHVAFLVAPPIGRWLLAVGLLLGLSMAQSNLELARQAVQDWQAANTR